MKDYHIFANHAHVFPEKARPGCGIDSLKALMDECSIERAVCFAPFPSQYKEYKMPGDCISWLAGAIKNDDSLVGFGTIDFDSGDITGQVNRIADLGFRGIKLHPAYQEFNIMGDKACEVYSAAQENGLFLSFHTGLHWHRIADYQPLLFDEVAWNFPCLKFSMEHVGGYHFFREALAVICNNHHRASDPRRVYAGLTSIMPDDNGLPDYWTLSDDELLTLIHQGDDDCAIFGLDFPYRKALYDKMGSDPEFKKDVLDTIKSTLYGDDAEKLLKSNPAKFYDRFNQALATPQFQSKGIHKKFYSELEKRGYNAILDINDTRYSGYKDISKSPTIFFGDGKWEKIGSRQLSDTEIDNNVVKYTSTLLAKQFGKEAVGIAAAIGVGKNISDSQKINRYLDEHPNSKLSKKEILEAVRQEAYR